MVRFALAVALICGLFGILAAAAEPVFVPGSRIGMVPPRGFTPSKEFKGFLSAEEQGSILIMEMPARAYGQVSSLSDAGWATKSITVLSRTKMRIVGIANTASSTADFNTFREVRNGVRIR